MTYDLALGRRTHDLVFQQITPPWWEPRYTILPIDGADRVAQQVKMTLLAFLGEWFLDVRFGVPYLEDILIKNPRLSSVESILRSKIMAVPDVSRLTFFAMTFVREQRSLMVEYHAETPLGPIKDSVRLNTMLRTA
jgi:hypothetical protein